MSNHHRYSNLGLTLLVLIILLGAGSCAGTSPIYVLPGEQPHSNFAAHKQSEDIRIEPRFSHGKITVDVFPKRGEGYIDMAIRISNQPKQWRRLKKWNRNREFPQVGRAVAVPFWFLNARYRVRAVKALFPNDAYKAAGWKHKVKFRGETMWFIAEVFTGDGANHSKIQQHNGLEKGQPIHIDNVIKVPLELLSEEYTAALPDHPDLTFEKGSDGKLYAAYKLKEGEALYSSVVVRFTGRVDGKDVNEMAQKLMRINGIGDATRIPTGKKIRIPFDDLSDDFATAGAPDRVVKVQRSGRASKLHVILDPGHGGVDPGAIRDGITEDELSFDVMIRLKHILERRGVTVHTTVYDPNDRRPRNTGRLINGKGERINSTPPYPIKNTRVNVNLRIYLISAIYERLMRQGVDPRHIYMISIHVDHLHPSMQGAMIYYPHARERSSRFKASGRIYRKFAESRRSRITFSASENRRAESYSYDFSRSLVRNLGRKKIPVHSHRPIRPFVYRRNRKWTPGIIRYSKVPTSILLEVANMANRSDFSRVRNYRFRQKVAEAIAEAILG